MYLNKGFSVFVLNLCQTVARLWLYIYVYYTETVFSNQHSNKYLTDWTAAVIRLYVYVILWTTEPSLGNFSKKGDISKTVFPCSFEGWICDWISKMFFVWRGRTTLRSKCTLLNSTCHLRGPDLVTRSTVACSVAVAHARPCRSRLRRHLWRIYPLFTLELAAVANHFILRN